MLSEVNLNIVSKLREECHIPFGDVFLIPTEQYDLHDGEREYHAAGFVVEIAGKAIGRAEKK